MKSTSKCRETDHQNHHDFLKKVKSHFLANTFSLFICSTLIAIITIFCFYHKNDLNRINTFIQSNKELETCDLFEGQWIPDATGPLYTNYSCKYIPFSRNCFFHGRKDREFLQWRWKPDQCELPRFSPQTFLSILRGKNMAFIGDSIARNQMDSLLCLLSTVETPKLMENSAENKFTTWEFPEHNFTLRAFWSPFLVNVSEHLVNGSRTGGFDLHLDRVDTRWLEKLPSIDYAVFSAAHWFYRRNYLYEGGNLIGCIYCRAPNVTNLGADWATGKAIGAAFKAINDCKNCTKIISFLSTYSPDHFENGPWYAGGFCNRTRLMGRDDVKMFRAGWEYRKIQVEQVETARSGGQRRGNEFEVLDVTEMMLTRVDGHPGRYRGNRSDKEYSDCLHWCLPGPVDTWNEILLERIKRQVSTSSEK